MDSQSVTQLPEIVEHPVHVGYGVSRDGRVWSRRRFVTVGGKGAVSLLTDEWRPIKPSRAGEGYWKFGANNGRGTKTHVYIHVAVLETFVSKRPKGMQCCHHNGIRSDNRLENLRWDTVKNNHADKERHGTVRNGERNNLSKLTESQVIEIRARYSAGGVTQEGLAAEYGITQTPVYKIVNRISWKHI